MRLPDNKIKVLVLDEAGVCTPLSLLLQQEEGIQLVRSLIGQFGSHSSPMQHVQASNPDLVILGVSANQHGLQMIGTIMAGAPIPILVIIAKDVPEFSQAAIAKGALQVLTCRAVMASQKGAGFASQVKMLSKVKVISHVSGHTAAAKRNKRFGAREADASQRMVAISISTGGPKTLAKFLPHLPEDFPAPILIAQHISDDFVGGLVSWLASFVPMKIKVAEQGEILKVGTIYFSKCEQHMALDRRGRVSYVAVKEGDLFRPSGDVLLTSVARLYGPHSIGMVLTGMGYDGAEGLCQIKQAGGVTIAQDQETSIVFGMPKVAIEKQCADYVLPIESMAAKVKYLIKKRV